MKNIAKLSTLLIMPLLLAGCGGTTQDIGLEINRDECFKRMNKLARDEGGYSLNYTYFNGEETQNITFSEKGKVSYVINGLDDAIAFKNNGDYIHMYYGSPLSLTYAGSYKGDNYEQSVAQKGILYKAFYLNTYFTKRSEVETYLGREAVVYDFEYQMDENSPIYRYEARIDKLYGFALELKCVDSNHKLYDYLDLKCNSFTIKDGVVVPELSDPEYIIEFGNEETFVEASVPESVIFKVATDKDGGFAYVVSKGEGLYIYNHLDEWNKHSYFFKKVDNKYKYYEKKFMDAPDSTWEPMSDLDVNTRNDALGYFFLNDIFSLQNMNETAITGYDRINGFNVEIREDRYSKYYFSRENNVLIKIINKNQPDYLREVYKYNTSDVPDFLDTPDHPAEKNSDVVDYYETH